MDIQNLRKLNNSYVNQLLNQNRVDESLALEIIDLHLQPLSIIQLVYEKSLNDNQKKPNEKNDFLSSITEAILEENLYCTYPEERNLIINEINTIALGIKYSDLSEDEFKDELKILNAEKDKNKYINHHHRYNYYAGLFAYYNKFGNFPDNINFYIVDKEKPAQPELDAIKDYLENYLENYAVNTYSSDDIQEMLTANEEESITNNQFRDYHQNKIDSKTTRSDNLKLSIKAIEKVNDHDEYLEIEHIAYSNALRFKKSIENDLPLIQRINNHTISKVIEDMQRNKELKASHLTMIKDLYSGEVDPNTTLELYKDAYKQEGSKYYKNGIKLINAIINDKNLLSSDPNVNPYLIIERHRIEKSTESNLSDKNTLILLNSYDIPEKYENFLPIIKNMIDEEIEKRSENSLPNIIVNNMSDSDIRNCLENLNDYHTSRIKKSNNVSLDECKDIIKAYFSTDSQIDHIAAKYYKFSDEIKALSNEERIKLDKMVDFLKDLKINMTDLRESNMETILSSYVNNNNDEKVKNLLDDVKSIKNGNKIIDNTVILIDKLSLEKDASLENNNNLINRIRKRFSL